MSQRRRRAGPRCATSALSGEPKFDADGVFQGYWGVGRDVTAQVRAQQAVAASEMRYRTLFARSPSPLVLHRRGMVLDANEAAARLFGYRDAQAMKGSNVLDHFGAIEQRHAGARAHRAVRAHDGRRGAAGGRLPDARARRPAASPCRPPRCAWTAPAGPALLTIYVDITARKAAEAALRRSEALLSHLFATSPDCLTLTEIDSGRYALVNDCFLQVAGYQRDEVIGRTALELGVWQRRRASATRLAEAIRRQGGVQGMPLTFRRRDGKRMPDAGVGRALRLRRPALPGARRARRQRQRADAAGGRGDPEHRVAGHRLRARAAHRAHQRAPPRDVRLERGGAARRHAQRAVARPGRLPRACAAQAITKLRQQARLRVRDAAASGATAACSGAGCRRSRSTRPTRSAAARSGRPRTSPSAARRSRRWPTRATPPRPPAAPRAPSWPTPATRSARR